jgi:NADH-quinone oxidoreductase subunit L
MPQTYRTFLIATAALIGIFPFAGFWSKDEILAGASQLGGPGHYRAFMVVGIIGAFMTALYMTRCVYLTFFGEFRGHAAAGSHPHESGPRIVVPLWILAGLGVVAGLVNLPSALAPNGVELRFEHYYEPVGPYFPSIVPGFAHPAFSWGIAIASTLIAFLGVGLGIAWYTGRIGLRGITERSPVALAGYTTLVNKYYFDHLYTDVIVAGTKGPVARGVNWFNQNVIDGVVNGAGRLSTAAGRWVYTHVDQQVVDGAVNGSASAAQGAGQVFRQLTSGKVQQYGALLFGAAALFAGVFIVLI